jgi:hypothetical protein
MKRSKRGDIHDDYIRPKIVIKDDTTNSGNYLNLQSSGAKSPSKFVFVK